MLTPAEWSHLCRRARIAHTCLHTDARIHKHNNVCLYCFSQEHHHFQAGITFSPAAYLPRTSMGAHLRMCVRKIIVFELNGPWGIGSHLCW